MSERVTRTEALLGAAFFVLLVAQAVVVPATTPDSKATAAKVVAYYHKHHRGELVQAYGTMLAIVAGIFFFGMLRAYFRRSPAADRYSLIGLCGVVLWAASGGVSAGLLFTLADVPDRLTPQAAQALNVLQNDLGTFWGAAGIAVLMFGFGLAMFRSGLMPRWLAWASVVIGVLDLALPVARLGFPLTALWLIPVTVILYRRAGTEPVVDVTQPAVAQASPSPSPVA